MHGHDKVWYVYSHSMNGRLIYLGMGGPLRPFSNSDRNDLWYRHAGDIRSLTICILRRFKSRSAAAAYERNLIAQFQPVANIMHNIKNSRKSYKHRSDWRALNHMDRFGEKAKA